MRDGGVGEGRAVRLLLIGLAVAFGVVLLLLPLAVLFAGAFAAGLGAFVAAVSDPDAQAAIRLTLLVTAIVVPANTVFGLATAWCVTRFRFRGRRVLAVLVALPFSVSPVVSGLAYVLLYGTQGLLGPALSAADVQVVFALPGIVLVTMFVTSPIVAGQLLPLMASHGIEEEEAALLLGAGALRLFWRVTLPKVKWGLLYGVLLCSARAMGEFGAVSVVSGRIRGLTNTMPLHIEVMYQEYNLVAAFAVATLLAGFAVATIVARAAVEWAEARRLAQGGQARLVAP